MKYGTHVDSAVMEQPNLMRAYILVTLFLSEPQCYYGELVIYRSIRRALLGANQGTL